jgi:hypothetical protein
MRGERRSAAHLSGVWGNGVRRQILTEESPVPAFYTAVIVIPVPEFEGWIADWPASDQTSEHRDLFIEPFPLRDWAPDLLSCISWLAEHRCGLVPTLRKLRGGPTEKLLRKTRKIQSEDRYQGTPSRAGGDACHDPPRSKKPTCSNTLKHMINCFIHVSRRLTVAEGFIKRSPMFRRLQKSTPVGPLKRGSVCNH